MRLTEGSKLHAKAARDFAAVSANVEALEHRKRVKELKELVATGQYRVFPQKLALKILVKALNG
jgi:anti-sigma28 factor (negative regulator of flagellin synthesis)